MLHCFRGFKVGDKEKVLLNGSDISLGDIRIGTDVEMSKYYNKSLKPSVK